MTETATKRPDVDDPTDHEEPKYVLFRTPGQQGLLPDPGQRRFAEFFKRRALQLDTSLDAHEAKDQSDWSDLDIYCDEAWRAWAGQL